MAGEVLLAAGREVRHYNQTAEGMATTSKRSPVRRGDKCKTF